VLQFKNIFPHINEPLLSPGTSTLTTKLLRLHAARIRNEQCTVICNKSLLQADCLCSILELGIVRHERFSDGLADGINLGNVATTFDAYADVNTRIGILANN